MRTAKTWLVCVLVCLALCTAIGGFDRERTEELASSGGRKAPRTRGVEVISDKTKKSSRRDARLRHKLRGTVNHLTKFFKNTVSIVEKNLNRVKVSEQSGLVRDLTVDFDKMTMTNAAFQGKKIYVYDLPTKFNKGPAKELGLDVDPLNPGKHDNNKIRGTPMAKLVNNQLMANLETIIHDKMADNNPLRVLDPANADIFFIPVYPVTLCMKFWLWEEEKSCSHPPCEKKQKACTPERHKMAEAVEWIRGQKKLKQYFDRNDGADHFMMTFYDYGPCMEYLHAKAEKAGVAPQLKKVNFISHYGVHKPDRCFKPSDIVVPPFTHSHKFKSFKKTNFAYFRGSLDNNGGSREDTLREALLMSLKVPGGGTCEVSFGPTKKPNCKVGGMGVITSDTFVETPQYVKEMGSSLFCFCPFGFALWSFRVYEAVAAGCIPVLFDDRREVMPFEHVLDWDSFSVRIPQKRAADTLLALNKISKSKIARMQKSLAEAKEIVLWDHSKDGTFSSLLYSVVRRVNATTSPSSHL